MYAKVSGHVRVRIMSAATSARAYLCVVPPEPIRLQISRQDAARARPRIGEDAAPATALETAEDRENGPRWTCGYRVAGGIRFEEMNVKIRIKCVVICCEEDFSCLDNGVPARRKPSVHRAT